MADVGVRALKDQLSQYLRRARLGERIVVTDRGRPIAVISAVGEGPEVQHAWELVRRGQARWSGGKPRGLIAGPKTPRRDTTQLILEDRW